MTQPTPSPDAAALAAGYRQTTQTLRDNLTAYLTAMWAALGEYRAPQMATLVREVVPLVEAAMGQMSTLTSGYLATLSQLVGASATPVTLSGSRLTVGAVRNGADPAEVYGRPFHLVWRQLGDAQSADGSLTAQDVQAAIEAGLKRLEQTALTDVQLAKTHTAQAVTASARQVAGYRRVLEGPHSCGLCVVASTQRYHKATLLPIHPGCDCDVQPIYGDGDAPQVLDEQQLAAAHAAITATFGTSSPGARAIPGQFTNGSPTLYRDVLIVHNHGELGPVLAVRGRPFVGPSDLAA